MRVNEAGMWFMEEFLLENCFQKFFKWNSVQLHIFQFRKPVSVGIILDSEKTHYSSATNVFHF